jgi:hypothetical protein
VRTSRRGSRESARRATIAPNCAKGAVSPGAQMEATIPLRQGAPPQRADSSKRRATSATRRARQAKGCASSEHEGSLVGVAKRHAGSARPGHIGSRSCWRIETGPPTAMGLA